MKPVIVLKLVPLNVVVSSSWGASSYILFTTPIIAAHFFLPYLCVSDGSQIHGLQLPRTLFILPEVCLAADQDDRYLPAEVLHFWVPLGEQNKNARILVVACCFFNIFFLTSDLCRGAGLHSTKSQYGLEFYCTCMHGVNVHMQAQLHELIMAKRMQPTIINKLEQQT